jgi:hypothetical protein
MKKTILFSLLSISLIIILSSGNGLKKDDPMEYHDKLVYQYTLLDRQIVALTTGIWDTTYTVEDLVDEYEMTQNIVKYNLPELKEMNELKDDPGLLTSIIDFYESVDDALENEYAQIISFYTGTWQDSYGDKIYDLDAKAVEMLIEKENAVIDQQERFANAFNFDLD